MQIKRMNTLNPRREAHPSARVVRVQRDYVLGFASALTTEQDDPDAVIANAKVLLDWMEVPDPADRDARYRALARAHHNRSFTRERDDDPALLITEAEVFYAVLKES